MSKSRFSSLDVRREVADLRAKLLGLRVANIYDINKKTYLLKCSRPDFKTFLLIESGIRFHSTQYSRDKSEVPSVFAMKVSALVQSPASSIALSSFSVTEVLLNVIFYCCGTVFGSFCASRLSF